MIDKEPMIHRYLLLLTWLLSIPQSWSQMRPAIIFFKTDSTSVEGFGEIKKNKIFFKVEEKDEPSEWTHEVVKGITFSSYGYSEKYEYLEVAPKKKPILVQVVDEGAATLYLDVFVKNNFFKPIIPVSTNHITANGIQTTSLTNYNTGFNSDLKAVFYVRRKNEPYPTNLSSGFAKTAPKYFADCGLLVKKIKTGEFSTKNIEDLVNYYNNYCYDEAADTPQED